ncbi:hypothetical protein V2J09_022895 [Rumex salicifolius]
MASPEVVVALAAPLPSVLDSANIVSKKRQIQISYTKKPLFFYVSLAKRRIQEDHEVELSALGTAITTAVVVSEILKNSGFALLKKIITSSVPTEDKNLDRMMYKPKILIVLEKAGKADSLMTATDSKTKTDESTDIDHSRKPLTSDGDHNDSTEGDNGDFIDGDQKHPTIGAHKDSTDEENKDSTDGDHKNPTDVRLYFQSLVRRENPVVGHSAIVIFNRAPCVCQLKPLIMAEIEQEFSVDEYEPQLLSGAEIDNQILDATDPEQQNLVINGFDQQTFPLDGDQDFMVHETEQFDVVHAADQFDAHESKQDSEFVLEQNIGEHESDHQLAEIEADEVPLEDNSMQVIDDSDQIETKEDAEELHLEIDEDQTYNATMDSEDKRWPGWPGESVFRMLVPAQKVGNIIGRKGEYIKKIVEETRARIKILDGPPGTAERAVMVSAKEEPDASLPPAVDGLLRVHKRIVDGLEGDSAQASAGTGGKVSTKFLVPATQAGSLIGKQGATVKSIQETSGCIVRVLGAESLPVFALRDDRVVEVVGEPATVHKAIELIGSQLRKFLVDRTVIPLFEMQMQNPSSHMEQHMPPHQPSWGPPHGIPSNAGGPGYGSGPQYMPPPPRQHDNYYPPADMPPSADRQPHHGISAYGREPTLGVQAPSNPQSAPSMITQVTQHMQIPLSYADAVIGASGSNISYIRRASGSTVTIQETRGVPGEMTVEISGSASQVQAAQQLIQNYMAGAGAPAPTQTSAPSEQGYSQGGYSSYTSAAAPTYGSPPASTGYANQQGAYGSVYGGNYGY